MKTSLRLSPLHWVRLVLFDSTREAPSVRQKTGETSRMIKSTTWRLSASHLENGTNLTNLQILIAILASKTWFKFKRSKSSAWILRLYDSPTFTGLVHGAPVSQGVEPLKARFSPGCFNSISPNTPEVIVLVWKLSNAFDLKVALSHCKASTALRTTTNATD